MKHVNTGDGLRVPIIKCPDMYPLLRNISVEKFHFEKL